MTLHSCRQVRWLALGVSVALLAGCDTAAKSSTQTTAPPAATQPCHGTRFTTWLKIRQHLIQVPHRIS